MILKESKSNHLGESGEPDEFVVYHSQAAVASFAALSLLMLPAMPWIFFTKALPRHDDRIVGAAVFTVCLVLLFGYFCYTAVRVLRTLRSPQPRPALVVNDQGFLDQSALLGGTGWVAWEDVARVYIAPSGRFLCITLKDEGAYLKRQPLLKRLNMRTRSIGPEGAPIAVMNTLLRVSLPELLAQMQRYQGRFLDNQNPQRKPVRTA